MVVPENLEDISPKQRCYFHIHMYGDGEISIYFAHRDKSGGWQKDDIFVFHDIGSNGIPGKASLFLTT